MAYIQGSVSGLLADVDASRSLYTTTQQVNSRAGGTAGNPNYVGAVRSFYEKDSGSITGIPYLSSPWVSEEDSLQVGFLTPLFDYMFNQTVQDTNNWYYSSATMSMSVGSGYLLSNASSTLAINTGTYLVSKQYFTLTGNAGLRIKFTGTITAAALAGQVFNAGVGLPVSNILPPTDGVWFQLTSGGLFGNISYNGSVTPIGPFTIAGGAAIAVTANNNATFMLMIHDRVTEFWLNGTLLGETVTPVGMATSFMSDALPLFVQQYNTAALTGTPMQVKVGTVSVDQLDVNIAKAYPDIQASKGLLAYQGLPGGTIGTTAQFANSTNPGAAVPNNTTAALGSGLGGLFLHTNTLAVGTDGIIQSYQVPLGGVNQTPRVLMIKSIKISTIVQTALANASGAAYVWSLAFGHTSVSLATSESGSFVSGTTKAPRRIALGAQGAIGNLVQGTSLPDVTFVFSSPIAVNPGEFIQAVVKNIGTVGTGGVLAHTVTYDAYPA